MDLRQVTLPLKREDMRTLRCGDEVALHGAAYTASEKAHKLLTDRIRDGEPLPFALFGASFYYSLPGEIYKPFGPNTCLHLDAYTPLLVRRGLSAMIGRGDRIDAVRQAMYMRAVYFTPLGGIDSVQNKCVIEPEGFAFAELQDEAIRRIFLMGLPVTVAIDAFGGSIYFE